MEGCIVRLIRYSLLSTLLVALLIQSTGLAYAQSLISPNYEVDAMGFFSTDLPQDFAPPEILTGPTVSSVTSGSAIVEWTTDIVSSSVVAFGLTTDYGQESAKTSDRVTSHTVKLNGLSPERTYHYLIKSADAMGRYGTGTDQVITTTSNISPISEVQITDITLSSAIVSWKTAALSNSTVNYGQSSSYGQTVGDQSAGTTTAHTIRLSSLSSGTTYHIRVSGVNSEGADIFSDDYIFTTLSLPVLVSYSLGTITGNTAEILWTTNVPVDSFISYWKEGTDESSAKTQAKPELGKTHIMVITGLEGKTHYYFRITGRDANGNNLRSEILSFNTPLDTTPPVITNIKSEVNSNSKSDSLQLVISWDTDEPAKSQIEYNLGPVATTYSLSSKPDDGLNVNHIIIVSPLKSSSNYHFRIKATDASGNAGFSADYSVLTPQKQKSLLQIILDKLEQTFGWLRKIGS